MVQQKWTKRIEQAIRGHSTVTLAPPRLCVLLPCTRPDHLSIASGKGREPRLRVSRLRESARCRSVAIPVGKRPASVPSLRPRHAYAESWQEEMPAASCICELQRRVRRRNLRGSSYLCPTPPSVAHGLKSANVTDTTTPIAIHHLPNTAVVTPLLHIPEAAGFARGLLRLKHLTASLPA